MSRPFEEIADLRFYPQFLDDVVEWHHAEWLRHADIGSMDDSDVADALAHRSSSMLQHLSADPVPSTFIALMDGCPVGSVSLIYYRMSVEPDRVWLTNLFVVPRYRKNGIGSRLVSYAEDFTAQLDIPDLYLYTFDSRVFYQQRDWIFQNSAKLRDYKIDILRKPLK